ncbi:MAG TPA: homocysteine S-methyltransferase family protein, partial [Burkholderiales bacterium]|nr:homocysteine S-methyltransferase family protein [Burkholderiales bacterium]
AGSDVVSTNSFGGSRTKLAAYGLEARTRELNAAAARLARAAAPAGKFVAGSIGPTGKLLKPLGEFSEEEFEAVYAEQAGALAEGGVDVLLIETHYDLREALCALRGARRACGLPVFVTLTFNALPRPYFTVMGDPVAKSLRELEQAGAQAVGANCSLDSEQMAGLVKVMRGATDLPLIAQANAGRPSVQAGGRVTYSQKLEDYVRFVPDIVAAGADLVGGCCGTNPAYIKAMASILIRR